MRSGPDQIIECPNCKALAKYETLLSGNTFGARTWTDGKQVAPMLPRPPPVVKCRNCGSCYWLNDAREVGTLDPWSDDEGEIDPAWAAAQVVQEPTSRDYYQALVNGLAADPEQERTVRVLAWWRRNDAFRRGPKAKGVTGRVASGACRRNLEALMKLPDDGDDNARLMKVEMLRELGEFEAAKEMLSAITAAEYAEVVSQFQLLCDAGDVGVRELKFGR